MIVDIRKLKFTKDIYNQIIELYSNFGKINREVLTYKRLINIILRLNSNHFILFYMDNNTIIGAITVLIEQKLIHNAKAVGHIEDFVVLEKHRNEGVGYALLNYAIKLCTEKRCYKCILDCDKSLENYYNNRGFVERGICMAMYF